MREQPSHEPIVLAGYTIGSLPIIQKYRIGISKMDLKQLKTFVEVADNGSYARTATVVGTAQSALSRQMSALERGIGGRLVHRNGRGGGLTELGGRMLPRAPG